MDSLVSIIVPVYHAGERLNDCVRSLVGQSCESIEIILVDDGSTQEDYANCEKWQEQDCRVRVIHTKNNGAASARNIGIEKSVGKYICFADADDYAAPDMIARMTEYMECEQADLVVCDYQDIPDKKQLLPVVWESKKCYSGRDFLIQGMRSRDLHAEISMIVPWNKLFRRELLEKNLFVSGRKHEDLAWYYRMIYQADKIVYLSDKMYFYVDNREGTTHSYKRIHDDFLLALSERLSYWKCRKEKELYILTYETYIATLLRMCMEERNWKKAQARYCLLKKQMCEYDATYCAYRHSYNINWKSRIKRMIFIKTPLGMLYLRTAKRNQKNKGLKQG